MVADVGRGEAETKIVNWIFLDRQSFVKNTSSLLKNQQQSSSPFIKRGICVAICTSLYRSAHVPQPSPSQKCHHSLCFFFHKQITNYSSISVKSTSITVCVGENRFAAMIAVFVVWVGINSSC